MAVYVHRVDDAERVRIQRFLRVVAVVTIVFAFLVVALILTARHWIGLISHETERRAVEPYIEWVMEHVLDPGDPVLQKYVARLGTDLAALMDVPPELELEFRVIEGSAVNAFTTLGGYIFVVDGLVRELDSENSLAMVLAHEIAHAANRDPLSTTGRGILLAILMSSVTGGGGLDRSSGADVSADLMLNAYSRRQEESADRAAAEALLAHYGHIGGATALFEQLNATRSATAPPPLLASHPGTAERIAAIESLAREHGWPSREPRNHPDEVVAVISARS